MKDKLVPSAWLLQTGHRLDCGPYFSGAIEARVLLKSLRARKDPLQSLTKGGPDGIFHAGREGRRYVLDERFGVRFLGSTDILAADLSRTPMISTRQVKSTPKFVIQRDWILITRSGTVGRIAYARPDMDGVACSEDVLRIIADPELVRPGYLFAYLSSSFGVPLVVSGTYGSVIQHIEPNHIADLPVPRLGGPIERMAHEKVTEAAKLSAESQSQVQDATRRFFEAVGLSDITSGDWHGRNPDLGFPRKIQSPRSLRALNFNPRFEGLCALIRGRAWRPLGSLCEPGTLGRGGRLRRIDADQEHGCQLIGQREIFWRRPEGRWIARRTVRDFVYPPGTILVAATGTFGESELYCRPEFVWGTAVGRAYAENFLRVSAIESTILPGALFAFLRSQTAFRLLRSVSMGTKLQIPNPPLLRELPVPYPEASAREKIHGLVVDAYNKRQRSVQLEDEAVKLVERAIREHA